MGLSALLGQAGLSGPPLGPDGRPLPVVDATTPEGGLAPYTGGPSLGAAPYASSMGSVQGGLQDFSKHWRENPPSEAGPDLSVDQDPLAMYHQRVLDAYDAIQKATQARITALQQMQGIQQPAAHPLQISPLQFALAALGAGIAGSSDPLHGSELASQALGGFAANAAKMNDVRNANAQTAYQNQLRAANLNTEIAGEGVSAANAGLSRAQSEEWNQSRLEQRRVSGVLAMIDRMVSPSQMAKLKPEEAPGYYDRLNKLYKSAGMGYMMMTPSEIQAATDGMKAREQAATDAKAQEKNEATASRIYSAAMANPSSPRAKQMLEIAKSYLKPDSPGYSQIDAQIAALGPSNAEVKVLSDQQKAALSAQIKGIDKQLDSLDKDIRNSATADPAKADLYLKLVNQRQQLASQLMPAAPTAQPSGTEGPVVAGAPAPGAPPGTGPVNPFSGPIGAGLTPLPGTARKPAQGSGPAGAVTAYDKLSSGDQADYDQARKAARSIKFDKLPAAQESLVTAREQFNSLEHGGPGAPPSDPTAMPNWKKAHDKWQADLEKARLGVASSLATIARLQHQLQMHMSEMQRVLPSSKAPAAGGSVVYSGPGVTIRKH